MRNTQQAMYQELSVRPKGRNVVMGDTALLNPKGQHSQPIRPSIASVAKDMTNSNVEFPLDRKTSTSQLLTKAMFSPT